MKTYTVNGTYGSQKTPCEVFVYEEHDGFKWYVCEGSKNVNATYDEIEEGVNVEELCDIDVFTSGEIWSEEELIEAVES